MARSHSTACLCIVVWVALISFGSSGCVTLGEEMRAVPYEPKTMPLFREVKGVGSKRLVLIHGLGGSTRYWAKRLDGREADYRILMVDLLGFGQSPKPEADYSLATHVTAVRTAMKEEGFLVAGTTVVGHSLGALVALGVLAEDPDIPLRGVLLSIPVFNSTREAKMRISNLSAMHRGIIEDSASVKLFCFMRDILRAPLFTLGHDLPEEIYEDAMRHTWVSMSRTLHNAVIAAHPKELASHVQGRRILFVHGTTDDIAPYQHAVELAQVTSGSRFVTLIGQGHNSFLSEYRLIWNAIDSFVH